MEYDRSIGLYSVLVLVCIILLFSSTGLIHAQLLGSPYPGIQENFNQLLTTNACPSCDLRGVVMNRLNLSGANLEGANLTGAQLNFVCLTGANLRNADLHGAWLIGADFSEADLTGTILEDTDFAQLWSKKARFQPSANSEKEKQDNSVPDLFADWRNPAASPKMQDPQVAPARRSVDDVPVLEITTLPSEAEKLWFWHYLFDIKKIAQHRDENICPVPNQAKTTSTAQRHPPESLP